MSTFSRILINPQRRGGRKLLSNPQAMHAAVRAMFPPDLDESAGRILWRLDTSEHQHTLYVVGPESPQRDVIVDQAGWTARPGETADYQPLLDSLLSGQERVFRLTANPVRSLPSAGGKRGKVVPHVTPEQQVEWLASKASSNGFEILEATSESPAASPARDAAVSRRTDLTFTRRNPQSSNPNLVTLRTAQFDGALRITDAQVFRRALVEGIGRGRAYGCGLMTIAKLNPPR
ncbi:type I-E CRISPR-associated protein Cas6/Cse3/CasE [Brachybacterium sp. JHP9]|uniref:Type I-E CRISPR-associated protein Cas6/Cse3/CasE n=1 Tax=Brachybacterium equifaecis TaxID=2910770 RepID=A0ABT0R3H7_9MICO|nr:type I-E CRISPR-associated protein Cas6/Cse3/CasE [Brachybacterium equifaecis]